MVFRGVAENIREHAKVAVAVKQCSGEHITSEEKYAFVREASYMKRFRHPNIVRLLGVCFQQEPLLMILELVRFLFTC